METSVLSSSTPSAPAPPATLDAAQRRRLARQIAGLRHLDAQDRAQARAEWDKGDFCRRVRDLGLWRLCPEHRADSFLDFVTQVTSLRSRSTVERRLLLVEHYSREEYLAYLAAGTCATALVEIARAEPALRPHLLRHAREGLTVAEVGLLRGEGARVLRARRPEEDLAGRLRSKLAEARQQARERRRWSRPSSEGAEGPAAEAPAAPAADEALAAERRALASERASLAAERQRLAAERAQLAAERRALSEREGPSDEAAPGAARPEGSAPAGSAESRDASALESEAAALEALRQQLAEEREELAFQQERAAEEEERLRRERARLERDQHQYFQWLAQEGRIAWPRRPWNLDATLLCIEGHLGEVERLTAHAREQSETLRQLPEEGGLDAVFRVKEALSRAHQALPPVLHGIALDYRHKRPAETERYLAARDRKDLPPAAAVRKPEAERPPQEFALPTAAILGTPEPRSPQHGVLGFAQDRKSLVTLDMNGVQTVALFGQQNAGKSHTLLALTENALGGIPGVSVTPAPLAVIHCHYGGEGGHAPGFARFFQPNDEPEAVAVLRRELGVRPRGLGGGRRLVLVPPMDEAELARRRAELPGAEVRPLRLTARELGMEGLRLLMGAGSGASLYMLKIQHALSALRDPSPAEFREAVGRLKLSAPVREIVEERLRLIERLLGDAPLGESIGPGDFVGLDMRAPWIDEGMAMAMFMVSTAALAQARAPGDGGDGTARPFRKMIVFDEAHRYLGKGMLSADILRLVREMRHRDTWVVYASQEPEGVHPALIKLASVLIVHQMKAKSSVKVLRDHFAGCEQLEAGALSQMARGEARVLAVDCADPAYRCRPQPVFIRPTCAKPGGTTRPAAGA